MAIEESGWGTSSLAQEAFNYFGQKWEAGSPYPYYVNPLDSIKYVKYPSSEEGAKGLLTFLKQYDRYKDVFNANSPREQITKIQQAGYNPDVGYISRIMNIIDINNLTVYDVKSSGGGDLNGYKSFDNAFGNGWLCPVKGGVVTSKYGMRTHPITGEQKFHHGTDIGGITTNTDYIASKDGVVSEQGFSNSMGNYIYIDHPGGYRTRVMHLSKILTTKGQNVKRGDIIGKAGSTGDSTGVHAHWEIRRISDNESTDPAPTLKKGDKV